MSYFAIQVLTREEKKYIKLAGDLLKRWEGEGMQDSTLVWPRRQLTIKRKGRSIRSLAPIFPGYVFLKTQDMTPQLHWELKRLAGFLRVLPSNTNAEPIEGKDHELILRFLEGGQIIKPTSVYFDKDERIVIISGPFVGYEGSVVKVDRRKNRVKIRLNLFKTQHLVDFAFEVVEPIAKKKAETD
jgi:transcriptional antiterminator NusG